MTAVLRISDGTTKINLLNPIGFMLNSWTPSLAPIAEGGKASSPFVDGSKTVYRRRENAVDVFNLTVTGENQDTTIRNLQDIYRLLEKAVSFWTTDWQFEPVWIEVRGSGETNTRYAVIRDFRISEESNPFAQPFFNCPPVVENFEVAIEHAVWTDSEPLTAECLPTRPVLSAMRFFGVAASGNDGFWNSSVGFDNTDTTILIGEASTAAKTGKSFYLFPTMPIPPGSNVTSAVMRFQCAESTSPGYPHIYIYGEKDANPSAPTTYLDAEGRVKTSTFKTWVIGEIWEEGENYITVDLSDIINEIIQLPGWAYGNNIMFIFEPRIQGTEEARVLATYDNVTYREPFLHITFTTQADSTCSNNSFVGNRHHMAGISNLFIYDASGPSYSSNLVRYGTPPYYLLPNPAATGDILYLGCETVDPDSSGPFYCVVFNIQTAGDGGVSGVWEISTGGPGWTSGGTDQGVFTAPLRTGAVLLMIAPSASWAAQDVNGTTAYWVRYRVTSGTGVPAIQQDYPPYACTVPYIDIDDEDVGGDLPARISLKVHPIGIVNGSTWGVGRVYAGLRSVIRNNGNQYTPYFNLSDEQVFQTGMTYALSGSSAYYDDEYASTSRCVRTSPSGTSAMAYRIRMTMSDGYQDYIGRFRVFLRCKQVGGSAGDALIKIKYLNTYGSITYKETDTLQVQNAGYIELLDFGTIQIPFFGNVSSEDGGTPFRIEIHLQCTNAGGCDFRFYELILMPTDEWFGEFSNPYTWYAAFAAGTDMNRRSDTLMYSLHIEGVTNLKAPTDSSIRASSLHTDSTITIAEQRSLTWQSVTPSFPKLQANAHQRLFFLFEGAEGVGPLYDSSRMQYTFNVVVDKQQRYISMRGNR